MPNFTPDGIIKIGRVPFDSSYTHTVVFNNWESKADQAQSFLSRMSTAIDSSNYTYVRMNNAIRVKGNAEELYTYNYCMYQNKNYGNKWFYAFIVGVNYVNENCTEFLLELDVFQTWWFEWTMEQTFVEREHVADDTIGAHLNPEPQMHLEYKHVNRQIKDFTYDDMYILLQSTTKPIFSSGTLIVWTEPHDGGVFNGIVNGAGYMVFNPHATDSLQAFYDILNKFNECGVADSIVSIFMYPKKYLGDVNYTHSANSPVWLDDKPTHSTAYLDWTVTRPSSHAGYYPKNNKLFVYPYCFAQVSDNNGSSTELMYEYWTPVGGEYYLTNMSSIGADSCLHVYPRNYNGVVDNYENGIVISDTASCSWQYSQFLNYLAQNAVGNALSIILSVAAFIAPSLRGASAASKTVTTKLSKSKNKAGEVTRTRKDVTITEKEKDTTTQKLAGAAGLAGTAGNIIYHSRQPNILKGSASKNDVYANGTLAINIDQMVLYPEFAKIVDDFFTMYGYEIDMVKIPALYSRPYWNYVKTVNCDIYGNMPAEDMDTLNEIFDSGVTIWHTWDVGDYSKDNSA